jgi:hypothetical protein
MDVIYFITTIFDDVHETSEVITLKDRIPLEDSFLYICTGLHKTRETRTQKEV